MTIYFSFILTRTTFYLQLSREIKIKNLKLKINLWKILNSLLFYLKKGLWRVFEPTREHVVQESSFHTRSPMPNKPAEDLPFCRWFDPISKLIFFQDSKTRLFTTSYFLIIFILFIYLFKLVSDLSTLILFIYLINSNMSENLFCFSSAERFKTPIFF